MDGQRHDHSGNPRSDMPQVRRRAFPEAGMLPHEAGRLEDDFEMYKPAVQI